mmetsp:Transcript_8919/g.17597  ORF Transcript_8919/g.17597 Transcript_8919/m.17597 type:complete len:1022 (-) Transcript_8919:19-3084(-)
MDAHANARDNRENEENPSGVRTTSLLTYPTNDQPASRSEDAMAVHREPLYRRPFPNEMQDRDEEEISLSSSPTSPAETADPKKSTAAVMAEYKASIQQQTIQESEDEQKHTSSSVHDENFKQVDYNNNNNNKKGNEADKTRIHTLDPKRSADMQMEKHLQSLSAPIEEDSQGKQVVYVAETVAENDDWNDDDDDDDNDSESAFKRCRRMPRALIIIRTYIEQHPIRIGVTCIGLLLIIAGVCMKVFSVLDARHLPVALLLTGCSLMSAIIADLTVLGIQSFMQFIVRISDNKEVEYFITAALFYVSTTRNSLVNMLWLIYIIILVAAWAPRNSSGAIVQTWDTAYYHLVRIIAILALTVFARIVAIVLRMYLVQDFGTRSYQEKVKVSLSEEALLAKLRRVAPDPVLTSLVTRMHHIVKEGGVVGPELWQNLLRYVCSHHVDGLEPRHRKHQPVKAGVDNGLSKRSRPVATSVFAWFIARIDANKPKGSQPRSRAGSLNSVTTYDSLDDQYEPVAAADVESLTSSLPRTIIPTMDERSSGSSPPIIRPNSSPLMMSLTAPVTAPPRPMMHVDRPTMYDLSSGSDAILRSTKSSDMLMQKMRRRKGTPSFSNVVRRAKAALDEGRSPTPKSVDKVEQLARSQTLSYVRQKRKIYGKDTSASKLSMRFMLKDEVMPIFKELDSAYNWDRVWDTYFDPKKQGFVTWHRFKEVIAEFYETRYNLALTLMDSQAVLKSMDVVIMSVLMMVVLTLGLAMYSTELVALLASIGTVIVGYSFIFGSTVASSFENIIFLFGIHPYDVGDTLYMNNDFYTVLRIRLLSTDFLQMDGNFIRLENHQVAAMAPISNLSTSRNHAVRLETFVPATDISETLMQQIQDSMKKFADSHSHMFTAISVTARDLMHPLRATGEMAAWGTHPTHARLVFWIDFAYSFEDVGRVFDDQSLCVQHICATLVKLGMAKPLLEPSGNTPKQFGNHFSHDDMEDHDAGHSMYHSSETPEPILQAPIPIHGHQLRSSTPPPYLRQ